MKVLGFVFLAICLVALGIVAVKVGWIDQALDWFRGLCK